MNYIEELSQLIKSQVDSDKLPTGDNVHALFDMYAVLLLAKQSDVTNEDVHNVWSAWMNQSDPHHKSLLPYSELVPENRAQDEPFVRAIKNAYDIYRQDSA